MQDACDEIRKDSPNEIVDNAVSLDGKTWQKRGFTSYNGAVVATSILTRKIIYTQVMSRYCQICTQIEAYKTDVDLYEKYKIDHDCTVNHTSFFISKTIFSFKHRNMLNFFCSKTKDLLFTTQKIRHSMLINLMLIKNM